MSTESLYSASTSTWPIFDNIYDDFRLNEKIKNKSKSPLDSPSTSCSSVSNLSTCSYQLALTAERNYIQGGRRSSYSEISYTHFDGLVNQYCSLPKQSSMSTIDLVTREQLRQVRNLIIILFVNT